MADIRTIFSNINEAMDYAINATGLEEDDGLTTAVIISLFTDRRAHEDDVIPDGSGDRRGWWGDAFPDVDGDKIGSRLWLLSREKQLPEVLTRAKSYIEEALAWLVTESVAKSVTVQTFIPRSGIMGAQIAITKPDGTTSQFQFDNVWSAV